MITRLRKRFIRIATLSVAVVLLLLTLIVNGANILSNNADLTDTLTMIYENQGTIPPAPPETQQDTPPAEPTSFDRKEGRNGPFTEETPYSTRYFVIRYDDEGNLAQIELEHIASVTEEDAEEFLQVAQEQGEGYGFYETYKFLVAHTGDNRNMAVFLDAYQELRTIRNVVIWSILADVVCTFLVFILVVIFSGKAMEPVARSTRQQKQFITDASHELKTPITVIATSLKVLEMETGRQKWIDKAQAQTEKLKELVNSLVTLSRLDEEESPLKMKSFPVSDAVSETAESFVDFARSKGHELQLQIEPDLQYCGDEYAVRQLVSILLDNAIKYAAADTPITFRLEKNRKGVVIQTANHCQEPGEIDTTKLFDRFYRADPSRNTQTGGFGIGLSIARSIAEGHKGRISAAVKEDCITFRAELK